MTDWINSEFWSAIKSLFASEVSYVANQRRMGLVLSDELAKLQKHEDQDWQIMDYWIARLHEAGVQFFTDPEVIAQRPVVFQDLLDRDEVQRTQIYERILQITDQVDLDNLMAQDKELVDHQTIITDLMAGECLWMG